MLLAIIQNLGFFLKLGFIQKKTIKYLKIRIILCYF